MLDAMQNNKITYINPTQIPAAITTNVPLKTKAWFGTGGAARYYTEPTTEQECVHALEFARSHSLPIFVLGHGANILISDAGFNGLVIHPKLQDIKIVNTSISNCDIYLSVGAGMGMPDLINYCLDNNILGLEEFSGIPGTVGGSVYINLHYYEFLLEQFIISARVIDTVTGEIISVDKSWFDFGYNTSKLHNKNYFLVSAVFKLTRGSDLETAYARGRSVEITRHRKSRYPYSNTCGSFFRNFHDNEVSLIINNKKIIYVAYYLDKIGVKGQLRVNNAQVSHQHANMIVNMGNATSADIINLARAMQELVHKEFGIMPQAECQFIGFDTYPLHS